MNRPASYIETKTADLRFVERDGHRWLQQRIEWRSLDGKMGGHDWRDVPLMAEDSDTAPERKRWGLESGDALDGGGRTQPARPATSGSEPASACQAALRNDIQDRSTIDG